MATTWRRKRRGRSSRTAGVGPDDIQAIELHDCFTPNELISYEALGLTPEGTAERYIRDGRQHLWRPPRHQPIGRSAVQGPPLGATGLAQCYELTHQLRGTADKRQVDGIRHALQHNVGLGGACVVTLYGKAA